MRAKIGWPWSSATAPAERARGRGSGVVVEGRESALWSVRDGKVTRYEWFHGPEDAMEALELGR